MRSVTDQTISERIIKYTNYLHIVGIFMLFHILISFYDNEVNRLGYER